MIRMFGGFCQRGGGEAGACAIASEVRAAAAISAELPSNTFRRSKWMLAAASSWLSSRLIATSIGEVVRQFR
jgi:hypothetical protein